MVFFEVIFGRGEDFRPTSKKYLFKTQFDVREGDILKYFCRLTGYVYTNPAKVVKVYNSGAAAKNTYGLKDSDVVEVAVKSLVRDGVVLSANHLQAVRSSPLFLDWSAKDDKNECVKESEDTMKTNSIFNNDSFHFGKVSDSKVVYTPYGIAAYGGSGKFYSFSNGEMTDMTAFTISDIPLFEMPVRPADVAIGDIIRHKNTYMCVTACNLDGSFDVLNPADLTKVTIVPAKNVFGFNFMTKVVNPFGSMGASAESPFGNPLMLMALMGEGADNMETLMMLSMMGGKMDANMILPFMMMSKGDDKSDMMAVMAMMAMNGQNPFFPANANPSTNKE